MTTSDGRGQVKIRIEVEGRCQEMVLKATLNSGIKDLFYLALCLVFSIPLCPFVPPPAHKPTVYMRMPKLREVQGLT